MERYYFDCADYQNDMVRTLIACFRHAVSLYVEGHVYNRMVMLAGQNDGMASMQTLMAQHLGMVNVNRSNRIPEIPLNIVFSTVRRYNVNQDLCDLVISCDLDSKELLKVEDGNRFGITDNIEIRQYADMTLWGGVWGVANPSNPNNSFLQLNPQPIVQHALDQISRAINTTNQTVFHPADDNFVKTVIMALHHHIGNIDSDEVFAYVIRNCHWPIGIANILKRYFDTINEGRYFHGGDRHRNRWAELIAGW